MAITEEEKAEIRRLTMLKMALVSRTEKDNMFTAKQIIDRAKQFELYVVGKAESDEKS